MTAPDGILVVDKPAGWTSHDVVARARRLCRTRKVGHAGTLDPMATGVLVLGVGRGTRLLTHLVGCDKTYTATVRLGQTTVTDDAEGERTGATDVGDLDRGTVQTAVADLTGEIQQVPSAVSAIKVDGRRSYARVRAGEDVDLPPRTVTVSDFDVVSAHPADVDGGRVLDVDIVVTVSSGTYVRALARDLGAALGVGGHLIALRRTRVGRFDLGAATPLDALADLADADEDLPVIDLAAAATASFHVRTLDPAQAVAVGHGQRVDSELPGRSGPVAALHPDGHLVALLDESGHTARSLVVFAPANP